MSDVNALRQWPPLLHLRSLYKQEIHNVKAFMQIMIIFRLQQRVFCFFDVVTRANSSCFVLIFLLYDESSSPGVATRACRDARHRLAKYKIAERTKIMATRDYSQITRLSAADRPKRIRLIRVSIIRAL